MSLFRFFVTVLLCCTLCDGKKKYRCDYKYVTEIDAWLKFQEIPTDWNEARLRCHLEGGNLASPTTKALKAEMVDLLEQNQIQHSYTGIHAYFSKGDYYSIEGIPLMHIPHIWNEGEPDEYHSNKNCLIINREGKLGDTPCSQPHHYICYKKFKANEFLTACGTTDLDYSLDARTGNCYKFHRTPKTWSRAYMTCSAEGGYLAIINSNTESQVIKEVYARNPDSSFVGYPIHMRKDLAFIGFHDWSEHGHWHDQIVVKHEHIQNQ